MSLPVLGATHAISLAEAKEYVNVSSTDQDAELTEFISRAEAAVTTICGFAIRQQTCVDVRSGGGQSIILDWAPVISITSVVENTQTLTAPNDYTFDSDSAVVTRMSGVLPWRFLPVWRGITVTYEAGFAASAAPDDVKLAVLVMLAHLWETQKNSSSRVIGQSADEEWVPKDPNEITIYRVRELLKNQPWFGGAA